MSIFARVFCVFSVCGLLCLPSIGDVTHISGGQQPPPAPGTPEPDEDCDAAINGFEQCGSPSANPASSCLVWNGAELIGGSGFVEVGEVICANQNELINGQPQTTMCTGGTITLFTGVCVDGNGNWPGRVVVYDF